MYRHDQALGRKSELHTHAIATCTPASTIACTIACTVVDLRCGPNRKRCTFDAQRSGPCGQGGSGHDHAHKLHERSIQPCNNGVHREQIHLPSTPPSKPNGPAANSSVADHKRVPLHWGALHAGRSTGACSTRAAPLGCAPCCSTRRVVGFNF